MPIPLQVGAPPSHVVRVATVSCGRSHSAFVCTVGELYTFGLGLCTHTDQRWRNEQCKQRKRRPVASAHPSAPDRSRRTRWPTYSMRPNAPTSEAPPGSGTTMTAPVE